MAILKMGIFTTCQFTIPGILETIWAFCCQIKVLSCDYITIQSLGAC